MHYAQLKSEEQEAATESLNFLAIQEIILEAIVLNQ